jgi:hypothetical protein
MAVMMKGNPIDPRRRGVQSENPGGHALYLSPHKRQVGAEDCEPPGTTTSAWWNQGRTWRRPTTASGLASLTALGQWEQRDRWSLGRLRFRAVFFCAGCWRHC